jgi:hypothetical protein
VEKKSLSKIVSNNPQHLEAERFALRSGQPMNGVDAGDGTKLVFGTQGLIPHAQQELPF